MDTSRKIKSKLVTRVHAIENSVHQVHLPSLPSLPQSIGSRFYHKTNSFSGSGNGVVTNGGLVHQNSFANGGPVLTVVVDPDKLEAAKKRREEKEKEEKEKEEKAQVKKPKTSWAARFRWLATSILSLAVILSGSSLLFIIPLAVDPILHGFEEQFSAEPVICRTTESRFAYGTVQCDTPSCREGCTADVYNCTFISVIYSKEQPWNQWSSSRAAAAAEISGESANVPLIIDTVTNYTNNSLPDNIEIDIEAPDFQMDLNSTYYNATLFVTPTGCGYPPEINCSLFDEMYMHPGSVFPCYFSQTEDYVVVPYYNWGEELAWLSFILGAPMGTLLISSMLLYLVRFKWKVPEPVQEFSDAAGVGDGASVENGGKTVKSTKDKWAHHYNNHKAKSTPNHAHSNENDDKPSASSSLKTNGHGPPKGLEQVVSMAVAAGVDVLAPEPVLAPKTPPPPPPPPPPELEEPKPSTSQPHPKTPNVIPISMIPQDSSFASSTDS